MIAIVIPTLNEAHNLRRLLPLIKYELKSGYEIIIIDDNSLDGTEELLKSMPDIKYIIRQCKMGYSSAIREGISKAITDGADFIITMDADLSHNPIYIKEMVDSINGYDVVIGSRYNKGSVKDTKLYRLIISRLGNYVAEKMLGLKVKDCTSGFRVYKRKVFDSIDINKTKMIDGYGFLIMITNILVKHKMRIKEFPIVFEDRYNGKSKISKFIILEAFFVVLMLAVQNKMSK